LERPLIKKTKLNKPSVKTALYYVRLKTHNDSRLFELPSGDLIEWDSSDCLSSVSPLSKVSIAQIAADELLLAAQQLGVTLEQWAILPDALHALISLQDHRHDFLEKSICNGEAFPWNRNTSKPRSLTTFIARFKAATAKRINLMRNQPGSLVWQRSYKEQLIEDELMLSRLRNNISQLERVVMSSL
jgi:REP element-mobilizing transposase RayT